MIKTPIQRWDAVDVMVEDGNQHGTKQFGYVVDNDEHGLVIDFGNAVPVSKLSRRIRQPRTICTSVIIPQGATENHHEYKWEAVVQLSPTVPYAWYPARLLFYSDVLKFSLAELLIGDHWQEYILPLDHIRQLDKYVECRVVWTAFRKIRTPVPKEFVLDDRVRKLWMEEVPHRKIIDLRQGYLYYLMENKLGTDETQANQLHLVKKTLELLKSEPASAERPLAITSKRPTTGGGDKCPDINNKIPPEILLKIFKFLDTEQQARARRVCAIWNVLLHLPQIVSEVRIRSTKETVEREAESCRKIAACVHKNISDPTQKLILTGCGTWDVLDIVEEFTNISLKTLILSNWEMPFRHYYEFRTMIPEDNPVFELDEIFGRISRYLVFDNVTIADIHCDFVDESENSNHYYAFPVPENCLSIHIVSGRIDLQSSSRSGDFWDLLEQYCPCVDNQSSTVSAAFQSFRVADRDSFDEWRLWRDINQILYGFESCDPRASKERRSMFQLNEFEDFPAIDARNLNKITLNILDKVFRLNYRPLLGKFVAEPIDMEDQDAPL